MFAYILHVPNPKEAIILSMYRIYNARFHQTHSEDNPQYADNLVYRSPLLEYALLTSDNGLIPLDTSNCEGTPVIMNCHAGSCVSRTKVDQPCLELFTELECEPKLSVATGVLQAANSRPPKTKKGTDINNP